MKIVIVTTNQGKLREIQQLLAPAALEIASISDFSALEMPPETGDTMEENALIKAVYCAAKLGLPCLADDSGLEVAALNGEPGVRSARWHSGSDQDRSAALLQRLENTPDDQRTARFRCALCLAWNPENLTEAEGICEGQITRSPRGEDGFGYDPIFEITAQTMAPDNLLGKTLAEISTAEKGLISHRSRAIRELLRKLQNGALS